MKSIKKMVALSSALLIGVASFAGCRATGNGDLAEFENRPKEVVVYYSSNAYGKNWITEIAKKYMTDHNEDTYINLKKTVTPTQELAKIESGVAAGDLYLLDCHLEDKTFAFESLEGVYDDYPIGESEKKISEKIVPALYDYYENSGAKGYIMPYSPSSGGYNFAYNQTLLEELYPDGYELPRTTDELIEIGEEIKSKAYLMTASFSDSSDYGVYMFKAWFAQLIGYEAYEQFLNGRYYDAEQDKYIFDESAPTTIKKYEEDIQDYFNILESIYDVRKGYLHADSTDMEAMVAESVLAGMPFGENDKPALFMVQGAYLEQEMDWMLADMESMGEPQKIRMCQMPVASDITDRTPSIETDVELRTVVDYVDKVLAGESATKPEGVTDEDIEIVKEARSICGSYMAGGMVIPKVAKNKAGAKDFLRYLASDEAAIIAAQNNNGINFLPYGKSVSEEELGFERTPFMKDCLKIATVNQYIVSSDSQEYFFSYVTDFVPLPNTRDIWGDLYRGKNSKTAEQIAQGAYDYYKVDWDLLVRTFKERGGDVSN